MSPHGSVAVPVTRLTTAPRIGSGAPALNTSKRTVSRPAPPSKVSAPAPPARNSSAPEPVILSAPEPPDTASMR